MKNGTMYCNNCKVNIRGNKEACPLCGNILTFDKNSNKVDSPYPVIPPSFERHLVLRILVFISIVVIVSSYVIYKIFPISINWPVLVALGLLSMWISLTVALKKRYNISKSIMWQVIIVSALSVFWDWRIGWMGWSLDYAIPVLCVAAMLAMYITAKVMHLGVRDYISYFLLIGLFGIIPVLFILFDLVNTVYPSMVSVAFSIIFLAAILIFQGDNIKAELQKKMHI